MRISSFLSIVAIAVITGTTFATSVQRAAADTAVASPASLVDPFIGTSHAADGDNNDDFPGADVPFGMVQWSPDTPSQNEGGGYDFGDASITGFSLTHLSGPGCGVFGDISFLPIVGAVADPVSAKQPFSHESEEAQPGWYAVTVGDPKIRTELTVTQRTGLGRFTFPASALSHIVINASSDQVGVSDANVRLVGNDEIEGFARSGGFCGRPNTFTIYFAAKFDRPFSASNTWKRGTLAGALLTFDTSANPSITVHAAVSYVSVAGARRNLANDQFGWNMSAMREAATRVWNQTLNSVEIAGGTPAEQRMFYTALYHALLHPNVFNDADGRYPGYDGNIHYGRPNHAEYANFSDWDIYRSQMPLLALLQPQVASDMVQSLVDAYDQQGSLPRWPVVNQPTGVMGGDSADPLIAGAYAFGARDFDLHKALAAMVRGASDNSDPPAHGWFVERSHGAQYNQFGYIPSTHSMSASETLEYAVDDFAIARFAANLGNRQVSATFLQRSQNWSNLMNTASGWIATRDTDGAFIDDPITQNGQLGFQEGNTVQYTWMVPHDETDVVRGMGGEAIARSRLDAFFSDLNGGWSGTKPYAWLGNEPSLGSPWVYLWAGAPWRTQSVVRDALTHLYSDTPGGLPGNDDLGEMSAWYVWASIGLYPENPATRILTIDSPLFTHIAIHPAQGPTIDIDAPLAADDAPYVHELRVNGKVSEKTWVALPMRGTLAFQFDLSSQPDKTWGSEPTDEPPSFTATPITFPKSSAVALELPTSNATMAPGQSRQVTFTISNRDGRQATRVAWHVSGPRGLTVTPSSGAVAIDALGSASVEVTVSASAAPGYYDLNISATASDTTGTALLPKLAIPVRVGEPANLSYVADIGSGMLIPLDLQTFGVGPAIAVGEGPGDCAFSSDGQRFYVAHRYGHTITVVDAITGNIIREVGVGKSPRGIAVSPDDRTLWVANYDDRTIQAVDTIKLRAGSPIAVPGRPRDIAILPDNSRLFVSLRDMNLVQAVDLRGSGPTLSTVIPTGSEPTMLTLAPDVKTLYVINYGDNTINAIDPVSGMTRVTFASGVSPQAIAISPSGRRAFIANGIAGTITRIDLVAGKLMAPLKVEGQISSVAFTSDGQTLLALNREDRAIIPVDIASGRAGTPIFVGGDTPLTITGPPAVSQQP